MKVGRCEFSQVRIFARGARLVARVDHWKATGLRFPRVPFARSIELPARRYGPEQFDISGMQMFLKRVVPHLIQALSIWKIVFERISLWVI